MIHDFDYVWGMVRDLRATSSTKDKEGIILDYCGHNSIPIIRCGSIMSPAII